MLTDKRYLQSANVGDSSAFLKKEEDIIPISQNHNPITPYERERIISSGIELAEGQVCFSLFYFSFFSVTKF